MIISKKLVHQICYLGLFVIPSVRYTKEHTVYSIPTPDAFHYHTHIGVVSIGTKEFGIMLTFGMTPGGIRKIMLAEAVFMGVIAMILGGALGFGLVALLFYHGLDFTFWLSPVSYFGSTILPVFYAKITWQGILYPMVFLVLTSALSVYLPAWRASRLDPVQALRRGVCLSFPYRRRNIR